MKEERRSIAISLGSELGGRNEPELGLRGNLPQFPVRIE